MKRKLVLIIILAVMVLAGGGIGYYYWYEGAHYVSTEDARISGDIYRVMPRISGKLTSLSIAEGDTIVADQIVGQQDTTNLAANLLENASLRAPINGTVIKVASKVGEVVSPGQTVAMVIDESSLYVSANIEETDLFKIHTGEVVDFTVDSFPGKQFHGKVKELGEATNSQFALLPATNTSGNFTKVTQRVPIKISIDSAEGAHLLGGMNAVIKIHLKGN